MNARDYWNRHAARYDTSMRLFGGPMPRALDLTAEAVRGAEHVLEIAAGTGLVTERIARVAARVTATDYAEGMVEALRARVERAGLANVTCMQADVHALPFAPGTFDAVVAANVLHLLPDLAGALAAMVRAVRPGGVVVVPTFCHAETRLGGVVSRLLGLTGFPGARRLTVAELVAAVEAAGVSVTTVETIPGVFALGFVAGRTPVQSST
jgi:phosphatidylethanolamine/phosphatidyl-N-methylethanolamine N-methyltransferase